VNQAQNLTNLKYLQTKTMATMDASDATVLGNGEESVTPLWVWIGLSALACASFWCQAIVTEER
jgi:hypothetical protein